MQMSARKRSSFTFGSSSSVKRSPNRDNRFASEVIVTKGADGKNVFQLETKRISQRLRDLRGCHKRTIRSLSGTDKENFEALTLFIQTLYDTEQYHELYRLIREHFGDLDEMKPGTVGAHFGGCLNNPSNDSCSLFCSGAVPPPGKNYKSCDHLVIWGIWDGKGYEFTATNSAVISDCSKAYLYVESFTGLSESEKVALSKMGVQSVKIICYTDNTNVTGDFIPLSQVRTRGVDPIPPKPEPIPPAPKPEPRKNTWMIVILIVLLLLVLFLGWKAWCCKEEEGTVAVAPASFNSTDLFVPRTTIAPIEIL
jgi:hypothetical protein